MLRKSIWNALVAAALRTICFVASYWIALSSKQFMLEALTWLGILPEVVFFNNFAPSVFYNLFGPGKCGVLSLIVFVNTFAIVFLVSLALRGILRKEHTEYRSKE